MPTDPGTGVIAHAIQLSVAPVFLLTGIAGLLAVVTNRLARVIDRARSLQQAWPSLGADARTSARLELGTLEQRRRVCSWSINFCTGAALAVCVVIVVLFVEESLAVELRFLGRALFVAAMIALILGLACFLREVYLATHTTKLYPPRSEDQLH